MCCKKVLVAIHCDSFCEMNIKAKAIDEEGSKTVDSRVFMIHDRSVNCVDVQVHQSSPNNVGRFGFPARSHIRQKMFMASLRPECT